ncbi:MAG: NlpC/P60 family protein [Hespellia sp.]|nr:NlpC/P60 family protein [Hespellia sp.]
MYKKKIAAGAGCMLLAGIMMAVPPGTYALQQNTEKSSAQTSDQLLEATEETKTDSKEESSDKEDTPAEDTPTEDTTGSDSEKKEESTTDNVQEGQDQTSMPTQPVQVVEGDTTGETVTEGESVDTADLEKSLIHAGTSFYTDSLTKEYQLTIADDFSKVMSGIEADYQKKNGVTGINGAAVQAQNWQDVITLYVLEQFQAGNKTYVLDANAKEVLAKDFEKLNALVPGESKNGATILYQTGTHKTVAYENLHISDLLAIENARIHKLYSEEEISILKKYSSQDCLLLCAAATQADGFVNQTLQNVSNGRKAVVKSAYSLVGKISYFWGGKSTVIGWDSRWGQATQVSAEGSDSSGTIGAYGLDCSGYVSWAYLNGAAGSNLAIGDVGTGTTGQWNSSTAVTQEEAQPGDLVFLQVPTDSPLNHVGIVIGRNSAGDLVVAHCNSSNNGVTIEEASSVGFKYVRRPNCLVADTAASES